APKQGCSQTLLRRFDAAKNCRTEISDRGHRFSHDAASPVLLAQPVTHCRCMPMHVLTRVNTDSADSRVIDVDAKSCSRMFRCRTMDELMRVFNRIWMRKRIAHRQPDFAIVRVSYQRLSVVQPPRANRASFEHELHRLLAIRT